MPASTCSRCGAGSFGSCDLCGEGYCWSHVTKDDWGRPGTHHPDCLTQAASDQREQERASDLERAIAAWEWIVGNHCQECFAVGTGLDTLWRLENGRRASSLGPQEDERWDHYEIENCWVGPKPKSSPSWARVGDVVKLTATNTFAVDRDGRWWDLMVPHQMWASRLLGVWTKSPLVAPRGGLATTATEGNDPVATWRSSGVGTQNSLQLSRLADSLGRLQR